MKHYRVFMIGWEYPPFITGGLAIACSGIARSLAALGHAVDFLIPRLENQEAIDQGVHVFGPDLFDYTEEEQAELRLLVDESYDETRPLPSVYASMPDRREASGAIETKRHLKRLLEGGLRGGYGDHIYIEVERFAALARMIARRNEYDVIHAHDWMTFPAGIRAKIESGRPLVCHVHATEFDRSGENVNQFIYDLERYTFHFCDQIISVSNYTRGVLIRHYGVPPEKISPVHNAIEFEIPPALISADRKRPIKDKIVLFLGRITFQKGPDYFVRAARKVIDRVKNVRFVMVGTGDMYPRMIEMAADLGVGRHFHYTGFLNREQVRRVYEMSDLYVMPSVSEPFGISPLEAMVHRVPVIVSKQSGVSEVIEHCIKVDFWDVDAIAESIIRVLKDDDETTRLRDEGQEEARRITWEQSAKRIEEVYSQVTRDKA